MLADRAINGASAYWGQVGELGSRNADQIKEAGLGLIPGYDLYSATQNPDAGIFDYGVGVLGIVPGAGKAGGLVLKYGDNAVDLAKRAADVKPGSFSIVDWTGYPAGVARPTTPVNLISGAEYEASRAAANSANRGIHRADPTITPKQIHEIQPVKFGGSPTDASNKVYLDRSLHQEVTNWWNDLQRYITGGGK